MKRHFLFRVLLAVALLAGITGCHSIRRGEPITGEMKISDPKIAHGEKLFMQHCYQCHPNGEGGLGPAINNNPAPGFVVKTQIRAGLGTMPSFGKDEISSSELDDLVAYVLALRRQDTKSQN
jgi:mono/diheme cytochrome c family protein